MPTGTIPGCQFPEHHKRGGGFPIVPVIILGVVGYAVYQVAELLISMLVAIVAGTAVVAAAGTAAVVVMLYRSRGQTWRPGELAQQSRYTVAVEPRSARPAVPPAASRQLEGRHSEAIAAPPRVVVHLHVLVPREQLSAYLPGQQTAPAPQLIAIEEVQ